GAHRARPLHRLGGPRLLLHPGRGRRRPHRHLRGVRSDLLDPQGLTAPRAAADRPAAERPPPRPGAAGASFPRPPQWTEARPEDRALRKRRPSRPIGLRHGWAGFAVGRARPGGPGLPAGTGTGSARGAAVPARRAVRFVSAVRVVVVPQAGDEGGEGLVLPAFLVLSGLLRAVRAVGGLLGLGAGPLRGSVLFPVLLQHR